MGYTSAQAKEFIAKIAPMIQEEAKLRGYKVCSTVIAQAIIEGAAGTSKLAKQYHNHFGMKAGSSWLKQNKPTVNMRTMEEYTVGTLTQITDGFRAYANDREGVKGYYDFIGTQRYAKLKEAKDYRQYALLLKECGYATSSTYVSTLCSTVTKYNLTRFDGERGFEFFPKYTGTSSSIAEALEELGIDSSKDYRKRIYAANFNDDYSFTAFQNTALLIKLKAGALMKP